MKKHFTLLTLVTSVGCSDPLIGNWNANELCEFGDCYVLPFESEGITYSYDLVVNEDFTGTMSKTELSDTTTEVDTWELNISIGENGVYEFDRTHGDGDIYKINCTMNGQELECVSVESESESMTFEKAE